MNSSDDRQTVDQQWNNGRSYTTQMVKSLMIALVLQVNQSLNNELYFESVLLQRQTDEEKPSHLEFGNQIFITVDVSAGQLKSITELSALIV